MKEVHATAQAVALALSAGDMADANQRARAGTSTRTIFDLDLSGAGMPTLSARSVPADYNAPFIDACELQLLKYEKILEYECLDLNILEQDYVVLDSEQSST